MDTTLELRVRTWLPSPTPRSLAWARVAKTPVSPAQGTAVPGAGSCSPVAAPMAPAGRQPATGRLALSDLTSGQVTPSHLTPSHLIDSDLVPSYLVASRKAAGFGVRSTDLPGPVCRGAPV